MEEKEPEEMTENQLMFDMRQKQHEQQQNQLRKSQKLANKKNKT